MDGLFEELVFFVAWLIECFVKLIIWCAKGVVRAMKLLVGGRTEI